jgi:hypothetical protein
MVKNTNSKNIVLIALLSLSNINVFSSITVKKKENGELYAGGFLILLSETGYQ